MVITPNWLTLEDGARFDVVLQAVVIDDNLTGKHLFRSVDTSNQWMIVKGELPKQADFYAIMGLQCCKEGSRFTAIIDVDSLVMPLPPPCSSSYNNIVELCCGIGAWSTAGLELGKSVLAGVDQNDRWSQLFEQLHPTAHFVHGDLASQKAIGELFEQGASRSIVLAGVSCQPHSRAGDRKGMQDERSSSLPKAIRAAWLLQAPCLILECVPEVKDDKEFQDILKQACKEGGYVMDQKVLHLQDIWCTRRDRWFCVLMAGPLGRCVLEDLPVTTMHSSVRTIMPYLQTWPGSEMEQITLGLYELCKFYDFASVGIDNLYLQFDKLLPTTLHSIGNQMYPCACGCRAALSLQRLAAKGLYGVLIPMDHTFVHENLQRRACRYPHPQELYLLIGGSPKTTFGSNMRLAMAGIGQCVSPIQGIWILAQVFRHFSYFLGTPCIDPIDALETYVEKILTHRDEMWPVDQPMEPSQPSQTRMMVSVQWVKEPQPIEVAVDPAQPLRCLAEAECSLRSLVTIEVEVTSADGTVLDLETPLGECPIVRFRNIGYDATSASEGEASTSSPPCPCFSWDLENELAPTVPFTVEEGTPAIVTTVPTAEVRQLSTLSKGELLNVQCPKIDADTDVGKIFSKQIDSEERRNVLTTQADAWADDEIRRSLARITRDAPTTLHAIMWDPVVLTSIALRKNQDLLDQLVTNVSNQAMIISAVLIEQHWYPLVFRFAGNMVSLTTCHGTADRHPVLEHLHQMICTAKMGPCIPYYHVQPQFSVKSHCGAMVVAFLEHAIWSTPMPSTVDEAALYHQHLRTSFMQALDSQCPRPWIWGQGEQVWKHKLELLLQEHGVATTELPNRIRLLIDRLGEPTVSTAVQSTQPWRDLKWHANSCVPPLQIIQPLELRNAIAQRVATKPEVGRKNLKHKGKGKGKGKKGAIAVLDPQGLRVDKGTFCGADTPVTQIEVGQIGPGASGIVLMTLATAGPYLRSGKQITSGALGLILIDCTPEQVHTTLIAEPVKFPATCLANEEPLLIEGVLFQLGAIPIRRTPPTMQCELVTLESCVVRILVFRDMIESSWESFCEHPMRFVFHKIPLLRPCGDPECDSQCEAWHPAEKCTIPDPLMEVWNKQYFTHAFVTVQPEKADCFSVHIRLPSCLQIQIQHYSGQSGVFLEPRQVDGKTPSDLFQVIWLPRTCIEDLTHLKQSTQGILGLARLGMKMGVRCLSDAAPKIHAQLKPGGAFLPAGKKMHFALGPLPFGTLKTSLADLLATIPWVARPLQPMSSSVAGGVMWRIQSVAPPPVTVLCTVHGEVVISRLDDPTPTVIAAPKIVASSQTLQLCTNAKPSIDPLQTHDPWAAASKKQPASGPSASCPIQALEDKVVATVLSKLPKDNMEIDSDPAVISRVDLLEKKVTELHECQRQMHKIVAEQGKTQGHQIQQLQQQGQRLEVVVADNATKLTNFQSQFQKQLQQQQGQLDDLFQQQLNRIEDLFAKKARKE